MKARERLRLRWAYWRGFIRGRLWLYGERLSQLRLLDVVALAIAAWLLWVAFSVAWQSAGVQ